MEVNSKNYEKIMKGTTTIGLVCADGVVLGADSRATMDTFIASSEAKKIWKIDNNLAITIAGGVGDAQELIRIVKTQNEIYKMNENRPLSPKSAASLLSVVLQQSKMMPFYVGLIVGGIDEDKTQLYTLDALGGNMEESKFAATGSGSLTALGYIEEAYKKGITTKEGIKIVAKALEIAMKRDSATGDHMMITVVNKTGCTEYTEKEVEKFIAGK